MSEEPSTRWVLFRRNRRSGYKKIFPALQAMVKRGHLSVSVIGVANPTGTWIS